MGYLLKDILVFYDNSEQVAEVAIFDKDVDAEFYIDPSLEYTSEKILSVCEVVAISNDGITVNLYGMIEKNIDELTMFVDEHWGSTVKNIYMESEKSEQVLMWFEEIEKIIQQGYEKIGKDILKIFAPEKPIEKKDEIRWFEETLKDILQKRTEGVKEIEIDTIIKILKDVIKSMSKL